ncbi:hypothetical protein [Pedobacter sp. B4-66]|uniref:hypothetical protein n=1 Tax=Pedobacter sp. B4-66 TaxID=2817280 RepID=UPI001BDA531B|nr:hypothetical protein [Pedobacter sp. B4-66]
METGSQLKSFLHLLGRDKYKIIKGGAEIRGISNLEGTIKEANTIIDKNGFDLKIVNNASMASYGAFEVREVAV